MAKMDEVSLNEEPAYDDEGKEYDIDGECEMTEYIGQSGNILHGDNPLPPTVGMEFESYDDVYYFYNCYAKEQGFGVRVSNTWYRKSKERYRGKLSCSNAGFKKKSEANHPRPETRTGCPAMIKFRLMENKRWRIIEVELEHNHLISPASGKFYKSHRIMDLGSKRALPMDDVGEVHRIKLFRTVVMDADDIGISNFDECEFINDEGDNKLKLKQGEAREMSDFFSRMQLSDPNFFYVMDINEKGCLRNVFWADSRCRAAYGHFCDVLFLDTTALIEKYHLPLVVFSGVNHHGHPISLGCGLVSCRTAESFVWLFRAWLTYMVGRPPQTVIIDQCKSLEIAIAEVFPRANYCFPSANIMKVVKIELEGLQQLDAIRLELMKAVYNSLRVDEFESAWEATVRSYGIAEYNWLQAIYENRKRWVPVYLKDIFLAGMFPVKENEKLPSPFEAYLSRNTCLKEFLLVYDRAINQIEQRETLSDVESRNSNYTLKSRLYLELHLSKLYTINMFKKFQDEIEGIYSCFCARQVNIEGSVATYIVKEETQAEENRMETREYEVVYNASDNEVVCVCALFNLKGYLCRHALSVINQIGLEEIPPQYVLARWRKDLSRNYSFDNQGWHGIDVDNPVHRYDALYKCIVKVVEEGKKSRDRYKFTLQSLGDMLNKVRVNEDCLPNSMSDL